MGERSARGTALAVDREVFSHSVHEQVISHPNITLVRQEVDQLPSPGVIATDLQDRVTTPEQAAAVAAFADATVVEALRTVDGMGGGGVFKPDWRMVAGMASMSWKISETAAQRTRASAARPPPGCARQYSRRRPVRAARQGVRLRPRRQSAPEIPEGEHVQHQDEADTNT